MGRFEVNGRQFETRGASQGAQFAKAIHTFQDYLKKKRYQNYKPKIYFQRQNLKYFHLKPYDMHSHILKHQSSSTQIYYICAFSVSCITFAYISRLIYDQNVRYHYLVNYPTQMRIFDQQVNKISSKFWEIGREYFNDYIIPSIRSEQEFYNFTYGIKNKIFKIEERKAKSQQEFQILKSNAIESDKEVEKFDEAVQQQDKDIKKLLWKLEEEQQKQQENKK
ncbi:transmembrane protein, putative (macronuclear) [Tetrahymena thermophila SB210]|uniref:Transmembrane protein, putative n=1 Tax=Tetrahymena thermophila (strain SB210) TaxID=312017 RepID=I7LVW3_TETTS|nr:transmembrane protein, putative [Tetrahymena thermophila SB210]EAS00223.1 transmembrane protein, putative [Tetrahymena thermophila SB210]|eukprot:XP_001020468.1 transmembrane protein, putative [Tetrahymena thermophila SB210]